MFNWGKEEAGSICSYYRLRSFFIERLGTGEDDQRSQKSSRRGEYLDSVPHGTASANDGKRVSQTGQASPFSRPPVGGLSGIRPVGRRRLAPPLAAATLVASGDHCQYGNRGESLVKVPQSTLSWYKPSRSWTGLGHRAVSVPESPDFVSSRVARRVRVGELDSHDMSCNALPPPENNALRR